MFTRALLVSLTAVGVTAYVSGMYVTMQLYKFANFIVKKKTLFYCPYIVKPKFATRCAAVSMNSQSTLTQDELKKLVGYKAVDDYVRSNMVVGLGTGSTAYFAVERGI